MREDEARTIKTYNSELCCIILVDKGRGREGRADKIAILWLVEGSDCHKEGYKQKS